MAKFNTNNALEWLDTDTKAAQLISTARSLLAIEKLITKLAPRALAKHIQVGQINGQSLSLIVPGPAHAARLNQISDSLCNQLNIHGWNFNRIIIRIDAHKRDMGAKKPYVKTNILSQEAIDEFIKLEQRITPSSPLADAIQKLIKHHNNN